jgi:hypothetical protein
MELFLSRSLLLCQFPLYVRYLAIPTFDNSLHSYLLPSIWKQCIWHSFVEEFNGLPQLREDYHSVCSHNALCCIIALHCLVHLLPPDLQQQRFPAIWAIKTFTSISETHTLSDVIFWSTVTYATWQVSYYFMISHQHHEEIAAGRPTSFTWLRKSFSKVYCIGEYVHPPPESF